MNTKNGLSIQEHFSNVKDPRAAHKVDHILEEILVITICAVLGGADEWTEIELFGKAKINWFKTFLQLPYGIPSHDTFGRVFAMISPKELEASFLSWVNSIAQQVEGVVAIDGKTLRRSYDRTSNKSAIHMMSAWGAKNGLVLGQIKTDAKSNEIKAIPELLNLLEIEGCIVTLDAMGCQKEIAQKIVDKKADYVLTVKQNQEGLHDEITDLFQSALETNFEDLSWDFYETIDKNHGRHEIRRYWTISKLDALQRVKEWSCLQMVGMVESECLRNGELTIEHRFYISSMNCDAKSFANAVRSHWGIENSLHWILDVVFREDDSRIRIGNAAENFSIIRRLVLNLIKQEKSTKRSFKSKRLLATWDMDYLVKVITG